MQTHFSRRRVLEMLGVASGLAVWPGQALADAPPVNPLWRTAVGLNGFESSGRKYHQTFPSAP
jgi:hypothetical protein